MKTDLYLIGQSIKARRKELNFTQDKLAKKLDMSQGYLADIENGKAKNPSLDTLGKIADALQINLNRLFSAIETEKKKKDFYLTEDEKQLIDLYRRLPDEVKAEIRGEIKGILRMTEDSSAAKESLEREAM